MGKERDEETGMYYYGARYYAAWLCRFVSVDAIQFEYPDLTPYQYASNRPVTMIDLDGLEGVKPKALSTEEIMLQGAQKANKVSSTRDNTNPLRPLLPTSTVEPQKPVYKPSPVPSIGPYNPTGFSEGYLKGKSNDIKEQAQFNKTLYQLQESSPVMFGEPGKPFGGSGYSSLVAGFEVYSLIEGGYGLTQLPKSFGNLKNIVSSFNKTSYQNTKAGGNLYRYMTEGERIAIQETDLLRGGRPGETFFTKDLYKSTTKASQRLGLESAPSIRVEFEILNNPTLMRNGTKVLPLKSLSGGGSEFMTLDPVKVKIINWQPLKQ